MDTGTANLRRPDPFQCRKKGDSEQLLRDFRQYRAVMELFLTAANTVDTHTGEPGERGDAEHKVCDTCKQEKAIIVLLGACGVCDRRGQLCGVNKRDHRVKEGCRATVDS